MFGHPLTSPQNFSNSVIIKSILLSVLSMRCFECCGLIVTSGHNLLASPHKRYLTTSGVIVVFPVLFLRLSMCFGSTDLRS